MKKRILSMLLVIVLVLSMVPVSALAEGTGATAVVSVTSTDGNKLSVYGKLRLSATASGAPEAVFTWSSTNPDVASVDAAKGVVSGKKAAAEPVTIVATDDQGRRGTIEVTVVDPIKVQPILGSNPLAPGETMQLGHDRSTSDVVTWASVDPDIATVDGNGLVTAVADGSVNIYAKCQNGTIAGRYKVTVQTPVIELVDFTLSSSNVALTVGKSKTITATFDPAEASDTTLVWSTSDAEVATVSDGVISAVGVGTAKITAKHGEIEETVDVTVTEAPVPVESVEITGGQSSLLRGESMKLSATVTPDNASDKTVTWTIYPFTVGEVSDDGLVTLHETGTETTATVTATCDGISDSFTFDITNPVAVNSVTISQKDGLKEVAVGGKLRLTAAVDPINATDQTVTWTSSDESIAEVDRNGVVTGVAASEAKVTITATCGGKSDTYEVTVIPASSIKTDIPTTMLAGKALNLKASVVDSSGNSVPNTSVKWTLLTEEEGASLEGSVLKTRDDMKYQHDISLKAEAVGCDAEAVTVSVKVMPVTTGIVLKVGEETVNNKVFVVDLTDPSIPTEGIIIDATVLPKSATQTVRWEITDAGNVCTEKQGDLDVRLVPVSELKSGLVKVTAYAGDGNGESATTTIQFSKLGAGKLKDVPNQLRGGASLDMKSYLAMDQDVDDKNVTWSIQDNFLNGVKIANINAAGKLTTKLVSVPHPIKVTVTGSSGASDTKEIWLYPATKSITITGVSNTGIQINSMNKTIKYVDGIVFDLSAEVKPFDADVWDLKWSTSDKRIADIDPVSGRLEILDAGKVRITCETTDGTRVRGYLNLEITKDAANVQITGPANTLASLDSMNLNAVVWARENVKAANQKVRWSITDEIGNSTSAAIVSTSGRVTAKSVKQNTVVVVTATSRENSEVFGTYQITIMPNTTQTLHAFIDDHMISGTYLMNKGDSNVVVTRWQESGSGEETPADDCQFVSSNTKVATVDALGNLYAVGTGTSVITMRCVDPATKDLYTSTFTVKVVKKVGSVTINAPTVRDLRSGKRVTLSAVAWANASKKVKADNQSFTWEVTEGGKATNVATISSKGVLSAKTVTEKHTVVVKAISKESGIFAEITYDIFPAETVKFYFELGGKEYTSTLPFDYDTPQSLKVRIHTAFANSKGEISESDIYPAKVSWSSSNKKVISISGASPVVRSTGKATLTAKYKIGKTTYESKITATVNRTMGSVKGIELSSILVSGNSTYLRAKPERTNATNKNVLWSVEGLNKDNVVINPYNGKLSAKKGLGGYDITVTATPVDGSTPMSMPVHVFAATTSVEIMHGTDVLNGKTYAAPLSSKSITLTAAANTDAYQGSFKWTSSNTKVAEVKADGTVVLKKAGAATIKAIAQDGTNKSARFVLYVTK